MLKYSLILTVIVFAAIIWGCKSNLIISDKKLYELLTDKETFIVDVRSAEEVADGSLENAINIPVREIENNLDKFKGKKQILVFCRGGKRADTARTILQKHGIKNVFNGGGYARVSSIKAN